MANFIKVDMDRFSARLINLDQVVYFEEENHRNEDNPDGTEVYRIRWANGQIELITEKPFKQIVQALNNQ
jgi:hypothetical protein